MAKPKGSPKTGGRTKGTPNKKTVWLREELSDVGLNWGEEFKKALSKRDYQLLSVLTDLLPYLSPKIKEKEVLESEQTVEPTIDQSVLSNEDLIKLVK